MGDSCLERFNRNREDIAKMEARLDRLEQRVENREAENTRQFAQLEKQMLVMESEMKALKSSLDTSHMQTFALLNNVNEQLAEQQTWMRSFIDKDKDADEGNKKIVFGWIGAIGTAVAGAAALVWNYLTNK